jgi:hypothetical protein
MAKLKTKLVNGPSKTGKPSGKKRAVNPPRKATKTSK